MVQLDPAARDKVTRAEGLTAEVEAARAAGDNAKLTQLAAEAQALQAYFGGLSQRVMALPAMQAKREAFTWRCCSPG